MHRQEDLVIVFAVACRFCLDHRQEKSFGSCGSLNRRVVPRTEKTVVEGFSWEARQMSRGTARPVRHLLTEGDLADLDALGAAAEAGPDPGAALASAGLGRGSSHRG
jgi:hypothetical protein